MKIDYEINKYQEWWDFDAAMTDMELLERESLDENLNYKTMLGAINEVLEKVLAKYEPPPF